LRLEAHGRVVASIWGSPAFAAGVGPDARVLRVDGQPYTPARLLAALRRSPHTRAPIRLTVRDDGDLQTIAIPYHGGLRYPHLVRIPQRPDYLDRTMLRPLAARP
ncbi:MAG: hypothetical protein ACRD1Y_05785, partial [Terriglobales bacterium]